MSNNSLLDFRAHEVDLLRPWLQPGMKVLEVGGGDGFQARRIASWGVTITSIDISARISHENSYFTVQTYGGSKIPFSDNYFDVVFSSNTLEHISDVQYTLAEMHRVLRPDGIAFHTLPTSSWRFWTSVAHYPYLIQLFLRRIRTGKLFRESRDGVILQDASEISRYTKPSSPQSRLRILVSSVHGEYPSAISELYYFSRYRWCRLFKSAKYSIILAGESGLFYTGYIVLGSHLSIPIRKRMARKIGSACHVFVLKVEK